jgi:iron uptake system EfeUOB component EfeO/EfeM
MVRNKAGRRVGPRRAPTMAIDALPLPRKARAHAKRIVFVERVEPSAEHMADLDSARIVTRFQSGDADAFTALYMRYFDRVYSYLRVLFREDSHEAEDLTQQVFVRAFEALPRYERRSQPFRAWLFTIARNLAMTRPTVSS